MPVRSEGLTGWLSTKWLVTAVALAADGLLLGYDLRLGLAAGALIAVVAVVWLYIALRYGSLSGAPSARAALVETARQREAKRMIAARASGAQQGADPPGRA